MGALSQNKPEDKLSYLGRLTDLLSRPGRTTANLFEALVTGESKPIEEASKSISPITMLDTLFRGTPRPKEEMTTMSDVLQKAGVPELGKVDTATLEKIGRYLPGAAFPTKVLSKLTPDVTGRGALGFGLDVATDPLTYITAGVGKGAQIGGKVLTKAGAKALKEGGEKAAIEIGELLAKKGIQKTPEELLNAGLTKAEREIAQRIASGEKGLVQGKGIRFAGKEILSLEGEKMAGEMGGIPILSDIYKGLDKLIGSRTAGLSDKAKTIIEDYYTRVNAKTSGIVDDVLDIFSKGERNIKESQRVEIYNALTRAEDRSKQMLSERLAEITGTKKNIQNIRKDIDNLSSLMDNLDLNIKDLQAFKSQMEDYVKQLESTGIKRTEFDKVAIEEIKSLPKELQTPAYEMWRTLRRAEKYDERAGLLSKIIPNYVPRKYINLKDVVQSGASSGMGGQVVKSLGGRIRSRKIGTAGEADVFATAHGGEVVKDIPVPALERLVRGVKAREGLKLEQSLIQEYGDKIPANVIETVRRMNSRGFRDEATNSLVRTFDKVLDFYKGALTGIFPSFHARNAISNKFLSFLGNGAEAVRPSNITSAIQMKAGQAGKLVSDVGKTYTFDEIKKLAQEFDVTRGFYTGDMAVSIPRELEYRLAKGVKENVKQVIKSPISTGRKIGQHIEETDRLTLFTSYLKRGLDPKQAATETKRFLFDYNNLTNFEKDVMKRVFPFYTFYRKSLPTFSRELVKQPRTFNTINDFVNFLQNEQIYPEELAKLPDWMQNRILIKTGKNKYVTGLDFGFENLLGTAAEPSQLLSQIRPELKLVGEQLTGMDFFRQQSLSDAAKNLNDIPLAMKKGPIGKLLGIKKEFYKGKEKYSSTNPRLINLLRNLPTSRLMGTAAIPSKEGATPEKTISKLLTGISEQELSEGLLNYLQKKKKEKRLLESGKARELRKVYIPK